MGTAVRRTRGIASRPRIRVVASLALVAACARSEGASGPVDRAAGPLVARDGAPEGAMAVRALGGPITAPRVSLADIARRPDRYRDQLIATTGRITSVCQEMGCWLELRDGASEAHVKIHGHSFFVPKTSPGHVARVQARVIAPSRGDLDCEERAAGTDAAFARVELEATGVEID